MSYFKEGLKEIFKNINASIIMIFVTLFTVFFVTLFLNFYYNIDLFEKSWKENVKVIVYPRKNTNINKSLLSLKKKKLIKSFKKINTDDLKEKINKNFLNNKLNISKEVIPVIYELKLAYKNSDKIKNKLLNLVEVDDVFVANSAFKEFSDFSLFLKFLFVSFSFLILLLCFILNLYSNKIFILQKQKEVKIMKTFGAKSLRILMPNIILVLFINIFSFILGLSLYFSFIESIKDVMLNMFNTWHDISLVYIFFVLLSILLLNIISSFIAYRKV